MWIIHDSKLCVLFFLIQILISSTHKRKDETDEEKRGYVSCKYLENIFYIKHHYTGIVVKLFLLKILSLLLAIF